MTVAVLTLALFQLAAPSREEADRLYRLGLGLAAERDTAGAVAALESVRQTGWAAPDAERALADLHAARGDAGPAALALTRAVRLDPDAAPPGTPRPNATLAVARQARGLVGTTGMVALALALYLGAVAVALLVARERRRPALAGAAALAVVAVVALGVAAVALWDASRTVGVSLASVEVRERPTPEAPPVGQLAPGQRVKVGDEVAGWRAIEAANGTGWVPARAVGS